MQLLLFLEELILAASLTAELPTSLPKSQPIICDASGNHFSLLSESSILPVTPFPLLFIGII